MTVSKLAKRTTALHHLTINLQPTDEHLPPYLTQVLLTNPVNWLIYQQACKGCLKQCQLNSLWHWKLATFSISAQKSSSLLPLTPLALCKNSAAWFRKRPSRLRRHRWFTALAPGQGLVAEVMAATDSRWDGRLATGRQDIVVHSEPVSEPALISSGQAGIAL